MKKIIIILSVIAIMFNAISCNLPTEDNTVTNEIQTNDTTVETSENEDNNEITDVSSETTVNEDVEDEEETNNEEENTSNEEVETPIVDEPSTSKSIEVGEIDNLDVFDYYVCDVEIEKKSMIDGNNYFVHSWVNGEESPFIGSIGLAVWLDENRNRTDNFDDVYIAPSFHYRVEYDNGVLTVSLKVGKTNFAQIQSVSKIDNKIIIIPNYEF